MSTGNRLTPSKLFRRAEGRTLVHDAAEKKRIDPIEKWDIQLNDRKIRSVGGRLHELTVKWKWL